MKQIQICVTVVSNSIRSITVDCKVIKFIGQVRLTRAARPLSLANDEPTGQAALAEPVQMKPLKKYAVIMSNLGARQ
jgi:hypothetical protein